MGFPRFSGLWQSVFLSFRITTGWHVGGIDGLSSGTASGIGGGRILGRLSEGWILRVLHVVVLGAARLGGGRLPPPAGGGWEPMEAEGLARKLTTGRNDAWRRAGWGAIVPFLILLQWSSTGPEPEHEVPGNLYTLF